MPKKIRARIANKTAWALEDAQADLLEAGRSIDKARDRVEDKFLDAILLLHLSHVQSALSRAERTIQLARQGEYDPKGLFRHE